MMIYNHQIGEDNDPLLHALPTEAQPLLVIIFVIVLAFISFHLQFHTGVDDVNDQPDPSHFI